MNDKNYTPLPLPSMNTPELATRLLNQLTDSCHELEEFGNAQFISLDEDNKKLIISLDYADPEETGEDTIFCNY